MPGTLDLVGERYGQFLVVARAENDRHGFSRWLCRCDCGTEKVVASRNLRHPLCASNIS